MVDLRKALELERRGPDWEAEVPTGWAQGRTTFGGLIGAYLARVAEQVGERPVRSIDVYFQEPVAPGTVRLTVDGIRQGRLLTHLQVSMWQADKQAAVGRFILAEAGSGPFDAVPDVPIPEKALDECIEMPVIEGVTPEFLTQMDIRVGEGDYPFTGSDRAVTGGYVRNRGPARGVEALLLHIDSWPPAVLPLATEMTAASTARWHVQFHADVDDADGEQFSWFRGEALWRSGSLSTITGQLVRDGRSVAYAEQTVAMYI